MSARSAFRWFADVLLAGPRTAVYNVVAYAHGHDRPVEQENHPDQHCAGEQAAEQRMWKAGDGDQHSVAENIAQDWKDREDALITAVVAQLAAFAAPVIAGAYAGEEFGSFIGGTPAARTAGHVVGGLAGFFIWSAANVCRAKKSDPLHFSIHPCRNADMASEPESRTPRPS